MKFDLILAGTGDYTLGREGNVEKKTNDKPKIKLGE